MKLYKPVLIESAEQAEALPVGTIAILRDGTRIRQTLTLTDSLLGPWEMNMRGYRHEQVVGFTALVPIEAEEETRIGLGGPQPALGWDKTPMTRYTTPWRAQD